MVYSFVMSCVYYHSFPSLPQPHHLTLANWDEDVWQIVSPCWPFLPPSSVQPDFCLEGLITVHSYTNMFPEEFASQSSLHSALQFTAVLVQQPWSEIPMADTWLVAKHLWWQLLSWQTHWNHKLYLPKEAIFKMIPATRGSSLVYRYHVNTLLTFHIKTN